MESNHRELFITTQQSNFMSTEYNNKYVGPGGGNNWRGKQPMKKEGPRGVSFEPWQWGGSLHYFLCLWLKSCAVIHF
jgi:hypothetical protein